MASGYVKMFGGSGTASSFIASPVGSYSPPQGSMTGIGSAIMSPNTSGFGVGLMSMSTAGGSPVFQSPSGNKFPTGGGAIVFTPHSNTSPIGGAPSAATMSPYSYVGGSASSFVQAPPQLLAGTGTMYSHPPYSSTMSGVPHLVTAASPITHGYGPPTPYSNVQPYSGYGSRAMTGTHSYHQSVYQQHHYPTSPYHIGHHSQRDEIAEPMHCSPIGQPHPAGSPQYQQMHRSPGNNPPRPQHLPAYLTGVDLVAAVPPRPRRVFDRSPSTSPPVIVGSGGRSPQKSPTWAQQEGLQSSASGYCGGQMESGNALTGLFTKRAQGQGPSRQLRFNESQNLQTGEEKEKSKRSGPPIRGFGTSEEVSNFLSSPLLNENSDIVPGAAIAHEAILKAGACAPIAESNWITVFGFPAAAASFIYTHFAQYGSIIQSKCNPGGNWLHIQYSSRIDARRALACNGKVLGGSIMVGVISSPKEVIEMYDKPHKETQLNSGLGHSNSINQQSQHLTPSMKSPLQERNTDSTHASDGGNKLRSFRPLATSNQLTSPILGTADRSSLGSPLNRDSSSFISPGFNQNENLPLPAASTGILTKAMEYMFGW